MKKERMRSRTSLQSGTAPTPLLIGAKSYSNNTKNY